MNRFRSHFVSRLKTDYSASHAEAQTIFNVFLGSLASGFLWFCLWSVVFSDVFLPFAILAAGLFTLVSVVATVLGATAYMFYQYKLLDRK